MSPAYPRTAKETQRLREAAIALQAEGYNAGVVARRMIEEHGMEEDEASTMVAELFGKKKVNARGGDTTFGVVGGIGMVIVGLFGAYVMFMLSFGGSVRWTLIFASLGLAGAGATRIIISLVNMNAKDDLRERRDPPPY